MRFLLVLCLVATNTLVEGKTNVYTDCTQILIGNANDYSSKDEPAIKLSDIEQVVKIQNWKDISCVSLMLKVDMGVVDVARVAEVANAIPKVKQWIRIEVGEEGQIQMGDNFRCLGYEVRVEIRDSEEFPEYLCEDSLEAVHINISFFGLFPHFIPDYQILGGTEHYIIEIVEQSLGFHIDHFRLAQGYDKRKDENGTVIGVVGEVWSRISEIGLGQPAMSASRMALVDYSAQISTRDIGFCAQKPKRVDSLFKIVRPLEWQVWLGLIVTICVVPIVFELLDRCMGVKLRTFANLSLALQTVLSESSLLHHSDRKSYASRQVLLWAWLPVGTLLCMAYSSNLLAKLILVEKTLPLDFVDQMLEEGVQVQLLEGTLFKFLMQGSPRPEMRQLYKEGVEEQDGLLKSLAEVHNPERFRAQREEQAVVVCSITFAVGNGYHFSRERIAVLPASFVVAKGSSLARPLNWALSHLMAAGLIERRYDFLLNKRSLEIEKESPSEEATAGEEPLYFRHFQGSFVLWAIGSISALLLFSIETLCGKKRSAE